MNIQLILKLFILLPVAIGWPALAQERLAEYMGEPPKIDLSEAQIKKLEQGQILMIKKNLLNTKRGIVVFRVSATVDTIWSVLKQFRSYADWIEDVDEAVVYRETENLTYVRFRASHWLSGQSTWHVVHDYPKDNRQWGSWKLDYDLPSDIADSVGFWRVEPVENGQGASQITYSADLKLKGFFLSLFQSSLVDSSLRTATQWLKFQAELRQKQKDAPQLSFE